MISTARKACRGRCLRRVLVGFPVGLAEEGPTPSGLILVTRTIYFQRFWVFEPGSGGMRDIGGGSGVGGSGFPGSMFREDLFSTFRNASAGGEGSSTGVPWKAAVVERMLPCGLEDLYEGTSKKMKNSRDIGLQWDMLVTWCYAKFKDILKRE